MLHVAVISENNPKYTYTSKRNISICKENISNLNFKEFPFCLLVFLKKNFIKDQPRVIYFIPVYYKKTIYLNI